MTYQEYLANQITANMQAGNHRKAQAATQALSHLLAIKRRRSRKEAA